MTPRHNAPLTTITIFTLKPGNRRWGLAQMGTSPPRLRRVAGLRFFQLLGSGAANGFGSWPNFDRYSLLTVWDSAAAAEAFFQQHALWREYEQRSREVWQAQLAPLKAHGLWDGQKPFDYETSTVISATAPLAVLTRAAIRWGKLRRFWGFVEPTSAALATVPGVRLAIGLGELPLVRQATFSIWDSVAAMQQYAYRDARHREVIQLTRTEQWYKEELFARFAVISSVGMIDGKNPV
jgi:heme-degrading monooxygenase HmoA